MDLSGQWQYRAKQQKTWGKILLPHYLDKYGQFVFRRKFVVDTLFRADSYSLNFAGIDGACEVYLNGKLIASHNNKSAFTPEITRENILIDKINELLIEIDTRLNYKTSLPLIVREHGLPPARGAIFRGIKLIACRGTHLENLRISTSDSLSSHRLLLNARGNLVLDQSYWRYLARKAGKRLRYTMRLYRRDLKKPIWSSRTIALTAADTAGHVLNQEIPLSSVMRWSPADPVLYHLEVTIVQGAKTLEKFVVPFAICEIRIVNKRLQFNGQTIQLRAFNWVYDKRLHQLHGPNLMQQIDKDLQTIKNAGANAVRVFAGPPPEYFLDRCDSLGLAVLLELPVINIPGALFSSNAIIKRTRSFLQEMKQQFRYHPSLIALGIGSGFDFKDVRSYSFIEPLVQIAKRDDDCLTFLSMPVNRKVPQKPPVDFYILELSSKDSLQNLIVRADLPAILQISQPLREVYQDTKLEERQQAFAYTKLLGSALKNQALMGVMVDAFRDYEGDMPLTMYGPRKRANLYPAGVVDLQDRARPAFSVVKALYNGESPPVILPANISKNETFLFQIIGFSFFLIFLTFYKNDRRLRNLLRRIYLFPHGFYMDLIENRRINPSLTSLVGFISALSSAIIISSLIYYVRKNPCTDAILSWLFPDPALKFKAIWIIFHPILLILFILVVIFLLAFIHILFIKVISALQKRLLKFRSIYAFIMWVPANLLFLLPFTLVAYRIMQKPVFIQPFLALVALIFLWLYVRTMRGMTIILQMSLLKTVLLFFATAGVTLASIVFYLNITRSLFAYATFYLHICNP